ncbi:MAG TPA: VOC family protein [Thermomicrobiales bacterium]|nr:VOC family protein [Thermomicrobiales bacterium]
MTISQIGIVVGDIESRAQAWAKLLGVPVPQIRTTDPVETARTEYEGEPTPARAKLAFFDAGQVQIELIEPVDGPSTWRDQLDRHGDSLHHIAFRIQGMSEKITLLGEHGLGLVQRGEYTGGRYAYLDGTDQIGTILELLENDG